MIKINVMLFDQGLYRRLQLLLLLDIPVLTFSFVETCVEKLKTIIKTLMKYIAISEIVFAGLYKDFFNAKIKLKRKKIISLTTIPRKINISPLRVLV